jgi:hypothetical protein
MTWKFDDLVIGYPPIEGFLPTAALAVSGGLIQSTAQWPPVPTGFMVMAEDPVWGVGEFIFAKANGTIPLRAPCQLLPVWNATNRNYDWNATVCANTANLGSMLAVCVSEQPSVGAVNALTTGQFGWFQISGICPVASGASLAIDAAVGVTAAGKLGAFAAGKQVLPARVITAATQTVAVASLGGPLNATGLFTIPVANVDGFFPGVFLSGTGVGASAICQGVDRVNNVLTASVASSALITGNVTATYNNGTIFYNVLHLMRPFSQGQIT